MRVERRRRQHGDGTYHYDLVLVPDPDEALDLDLLTNGSADEHVAVVAQHMRGAVRTTEDYDIYVLLQPMQDGTWQPATQAMTIKYGCGHTLHPAVGDGMPARCTTCYPGHPVELYPEASV